MSGGTLSTLTINALWRRFVADAVIERFSSEFYKFSDSGLDDFKLLFDDLIDDLYD